MSTFAVLNFKSIKHACWYKRASLRHGFSWRGAKKYLSKSDIRICYAFVRLILPVLLFEAVSCIKNVDHKFKKLNVNNNDGKIRLVMKKTFKLWKDAHFIWKTTFLKKLGFNFLQNEELYVVYAWNLSKCSKSRLSRR